MLQSTCTIAQHNARLKHNFILLENQPVITKIKYFVHSSHTRALVLRQKMLGLELELQLELVQGMLALELLGRSRQLQLELELKLELELELYMLIYY